MRLDGRQAVARLAAASGIDADAALIDTVAKATAFDAMKKKAADFAPVGGTGFWKSDAAFFDSASSGKWKGKLSEDELAAYRDKLSELVPEGDARRWLETGAA